MQTHRSVAELLQAVSASLQCFQLLFMTERHVSSEGLTCDQYACQQSNSCHLQSPLIGPSDTTKTSRVFRLNAYNTYVKTLFE